MLWIYGLLLLLDLVWTHGPGPGPGPGPVFVSQDEARQVLIRRRRANWFLEELRSPNMERECIEERCDYEEAQEIFQDEDLTYDFWTKYVDGDACESAPCLNQGTCTDSVGGFECDCPTGFQEPNCSVILALCENQNGGCEHFCAEERGAVWCSCADGYSLVSDLKSCRSSEPFKCGVVVTNRIANFSLHSPTLNQTQDQDQTQTWLNQTQDQDQTQIWLNQTLPDPSGLNSTGPQTDCPPGECPWQALLMNENRRAFCGGTILSNVFILTTVQCVNQSRHIYVVLGERDLQVYQGSEAVHQVEKVVIHQRFRPEYKQNDIALMKLTTPIRFSRHALPACLPTRDFAEKVLMRQPDGLVSGFGRSSSVLQRLRVPYVERARCLEATPFRISTRMFCAGYEEEGGGEACQGDLGGPHVTRYRDTYFVTGITTWSEGCNRRGVFAIYTQVSKYIRWIQEAGQVLVSQSPDQNQEPPKRKRSSGLRPPQGLGPAQDPPRTRWSSNLRPRRFTVSRL